MNNPSWNIPSVTTATSSTNQPKNVGVSAETAQWIQLHLSTEVDRKFQEINTEIESKITEKTNEAKQSVITEINNSKAELQNTRNAVLGSIAIFAAFFTFISTSINAFSKTNLPQSIVLLLVLWICLAGFIYLFFMLIEQKSNNLKSWIPIGVGLLLSGGLLWAGFNQMSTTPSTDSIPKTNQTSS
jgi:putative effector of murein hydrolase LrgA (UPF0299 family)